jgi:hypothetical protein
MLIPVVTCDLDLGAVEDLVSLCARYDRIRRQASGDRNSGGAEKAYNRQISCPKALKRPRQRLERSLRSHSPLPCPG